MTLRHLTIFIKVADLGGMNKAAKALHISQPSISQAVSELERYYGVKLFERLSQKIYLTKEGELLLSFSRHIVDSFSKMEETMHQAVKKSQLQIGCSVSVGTCLINRILDEAEVQLPNCSFYVTVANTSEMERAILNNQVDFGLIEGVVSNENLSCTPICEDELVIVCGKQHPFAKYPSITLQMLEGADYVSRESGSSDKNQYEKLLDEQGIQLNRTFCSTNTEAIKNATICGRGIAIFSKRMVEKEVAEGKLIILHVENIDVIRSIHFVIHKDKFLSENLKTMLQVCCSINRKKDAEQERN